jgi:hypothetical protein
MVRRGQILVSVAALFGIALFTGCGDEETKIVTPEPAIKVTVTATPTILKTGGKVQVRPTVTTGQSGPFSFAWKADGGAFVDAGADTTTWIAPDQSGNFLLSVVVTNGDDVAIGKATVTVSDYIPTDSPFYRGESYCATCHTTGPGGDQAVAWSASGHAGALATLTAIGQDQNPFCLACHTVGSMGLDANPALNNGGYDETAVARLANVQCENCHGPGSDHPGTGGNFTPLPITIDASLCAGCHDGIHHPTGA